VYNGELGEMGEEDYAMTVKEEISGGITKELPKKGSKTKNDLRRGSAD
jgi:hypothetical protein